MWQQWGREWTSDDDDEEEEEEEEDDEEQQPERQAPQAPTLRRSTAERAASRNTVRAPTPPRPRRQESSAPSTDMPLRFGGVVQWLQGQARTVGRAAGSAGDEPSTSGASGGNRAAGRRPRRSSSHAQQSAAEDDVSTNLSFRLTRVLDFKDRK